MVLDAKRDVTSAAVPRESRHERFIEIPLNTDSSIQVRFADGTTVHVPAVQKVVCRYYGPPARIFEECPDDSDQPTFRAEIIERAVLEKLRQFLSDERNKPELHTEIDRLTQKAVAHVSRLESQLADVRV